MKLIPLQHACRMVLVNPEQVVLVRQSLDSSAQPLSGKARVELSSGEALDVDGDVSGIAAQLQGGKEAPANLPRHRSTAEAASDFRHT